METFSEDKKKIEEDLKSAKENAVKRFNVISMDAYNSAHQMLNIGIPSKANTLSSKANTLSSKKLSKANTLSFKKSINSNVNSNFTLNQIDSIIGGSTFSSNGLDNKLLIVDEAHNFFRSIINSGNNENSNARRIYEIIMTAKNLKIIFLTGTPASKDPFELVPCFNMLTNSSLLPTSYEIFYSLYVDKINQTVLNRNKLANRLLGLVSHVTHTKNTNPLNSLNSKKH